MTLANFAGGRPVRDAMFIEQIPRSVRSAMLTICRPGGVGYFYKQWL